MARVLAETYLESGETDAGLEGSSLTGGLLHPLTLLGTSTVIIEDGSKFDVEDVGFREWMREVLEDEGLCRRDRP